MVFDGGALVEGSGQFVVVANHCCYLMHPQAWKGLSLSNYLGRALKKSEVRETQNDHGQDVGEGGKADKVFDGGALVEGSGQVVVVNQCCYLMCS